MPLTHEKKSSSPTGTAALAVAVVALAASGWGLLQGGGSGEATGAGDAVESSLARTLRTRTLRAGYSGFRPYTIIDLDAAGTDRVTGFCVDMVSEIASRQVPPWEVEWHRVNFDTLRADMESGRFDVFADAVYATVPRAAQFGFTVPYAYFGVGAGVVRAGESRFEGFEDIDREDVVVSLAEGWTATTYARRRLNDAELHVVAIGDDPFIQFQEVISGRADIALQDVPTVLQFVNEHEDEVDALWLDDPAMRVAAGFMTRMGDWEMLAFLNTALYALEADGTLDALDRKWGGLGDLPALNLRRGSGLP